MGIARARGMNALILGVAVVVVTAPVLPTPGAASGSAAAVDQLGLGLGGGPCCFHACFDQCVPRDEFWFCQFSCYHRCASASATAATAAGRDDDDCERSCTLSMCAQLRPGSKMMAACRDTCRKSYAVAACGS